MLRPGILAGMMLAFMAQPAAACRLALVLALDVSASVDAEEYRLQAEGLAAALTSAPVKRLLLNGPPVALAAFQWSGPDDQALVADWRLIETEAALDAFAAQVLGAPRPAGFDGRTAIGAAMLRGAALLAMAPPCDGRTIDIAADGESNSGPPPRQARLQPALAGITVNALSIGGDLPMDHGTAAEEGGKLSAYLEAEVIHGPLAFVERAADHGHFAEAMQRKLERELEVMVVGQTRR